MSALTPPGSPQQPRPSRKRGIRAGAVGEFGVIALLDLALLALIAFGTHGLPAPLAALRVILGVVYVFLVPGYALQVALFPRAAGPSAGPGRSLDDPERLALSFGLSVAIIPILALVLDRLPWGLRLWPIVTAEGVTVAAASLASVWRRLRLPSEERWTPRLHLDLRAWWASEDRAGRILHAVLAAAALVALGAAAAIALLPKPADHFTEFYLLGKEGLAEDYPRQAAPGEQVTVTLGIANREGVPARYRVEVRVAGELLATAGPLDLEDGTAWQQELGYALPKPGDDQAVDFLLYRDAGSEPYRRLRLWIDVVEQAP